MMEASHTDNLSEPADSSADDSADSPPTINTSLPFEDVDLDDEPATRAPPARKVAGSVEKVATGAKAAAEAAGGAAGKAVKSADRLLDAAVDNMTRRFSTGSSASPSEKPPPPPPPRPPPPPPPPDAPGGPKAVPATPTTANSPFSAPGFGNFPGTVQKAAGEAAAKVAGSAEKAVSGAKAAVDTVARRISGAPAAPPPKEVFRSAPELVDILVPGMTILGTRDEVEATLKIQGAARNTNLRKRRRSAAEVLQRTARRRSGERDVRARTKRSFRTKWGGLLLCATLPLTAAARSALGPPTHGADLYHLPLTVPDALGSYGAAGAAWWVCRMWATAIALYRALFARASTYRARLLRLVAAAAVACACWSELDVATAKEALELDVATAARVDEAIVALRRYAGPAAFGLDLLQVLALDLARTAPLRGLPLVVSGALVGLADYQHRTEWDAAVERCNSGYLSSPAMVDCWTPEWNQVLAWAQLGHLVLYLLYFAKHVYNDAATTKRHAD